MDEELELRYEDVTDILDSAEEREDWDAMTDKLIGESVSLFYLSTGYRRPGEERK